MGDGRWVVFYVACAAAFGLGVWLFVGSKFAVEYLAGYITEYSLSVDNLFIFVIIMATFRVSFALMDLRQPYVLIRGLLNKLVYLPLRLAAILGFIGAKLAHEVLYENSRSSINGGQRKSTTPRTARTGYGGPAGPVALPSWPGAPEGDRPWPR